MKETISINGLASYPGMSFGLCAFGAGAFSMMAAAMSMSDMERSGTSIGAGQNYVSVGFILFFLFAFALALSGLLSLWRSGTWWKIVEEYNERHKEGAEAMEVDYGPYGVLRIRSARSAGFALAVAGTILFSVAFFAPRWLGVEISYEVPIDGMAIGRLAIMILGCHAVAVGLTSATDRRWNSGRPIGLG